MQETKPWQQKKPIVSILYSKHWKPEAWHKTRVYILP